MNRFTTLLDGPYQGKMVCANDLMSQSGSDMMGGLQLVPNPLYLRKYP